MIIGKLEKNSEKVRFHLDLKCTRCQKKVPGGMATPKDYFGTYSFFLEVDHLKKTYMCGVCRDVIRSS
ncbi:MAG: hypothetical protein OXC46_02275 [Thaumarchaeota archaeon]|nr:hypothetical protein [Nitrososphaerota archaeon]